MYPGGGWRWLLTSSEHSHQGMRDEKGLVPVNGGSDLLKSAALYREELINPTKIYSFWAGYVGTWSKSESIDSLTDVP